MVLPSNDLCPKNVHLLKILNINNNDTVNYSLLLLKGCIYSQGSRSFNCKKDIIATHNETSTTKTWNVLNSEFKICIQLSEGTNNICLSYCTVKTNIKINYIIRDTEYSVLPLYIICKGHDGKFLSPKHTDNSIESACKRINIGLRMIQTLTAEKIHEIFSERKTFQIESEINKKSEDCIIFRSELEVDDALKMNQESLWDYFAKEIMLSPLANNKKKYLAFLSCTYYEPNKEKNKKLQTHKEMLERTRGHAALGGGGLALFGCGCLHTWPENIDDILPKFQDSTLVDTSYLMNDSCYRNTYGGCFATTLGAVCHELGHTFDLGHTKSGIMGRGFDNIDKVFNLTNSKQNFISNAQISTVNITKNISLNYFTPMQAQITGKRNENIQPTLKSKLTSLKKNIYENDNLFWTQNCATILYYHKWFNNIEILEDKIIILKFNPTRNEVESSEGLRIIELRGDNGLVLDYWNFLDGKVLFNFIIISKNITNSKSLFAEDSQGTILKYNF